MTSSFKLGPQHFELPAPGAYNRSNALAATAGALSLGLSLKTCALGLEQYAGLERRFNLISQKRGIAVVDDFAHNPAKIEACLTAARRLAGATGNRGKRIAIFHPHGFGPLKMLQEDLVQTFCKALTPDDYLLVTEAYYAGGTADKEVTAANLVNRVNAAVEGPHAQFHPERDALPKILKELAAPGDVVIQMGARDPRLGQLALQIAATLGEG